ncbi:MAG: carbohydrate ABC transporter permease [Pseudoflavonifractor sp.]
MSKKRYKDILTYLFLILGGLFMLLPFVWMILSSLKTMPEIMAIPPRWLPEQPHWSNYVDAMTRAPFVRYFLNSFIVTVCAVGLQTFLSIMMAYATSRFQFPGRNALFALLLGLMMVPYEMLLITNYVTMTQLQWLDTFAALIVPSTASVYYTYILRNNFLQIPDSYFYSARLDGANSWKYLWRIIVPMNKSAIMTIVLLNAIGEWNSFMWPMIVTNSDALRTVQVGLYTFNNDTSARYDLLMAAATVIILPLMSLFIVARKRIVSAFSHGGIKG